MIAGWIVLVAALPGAAPSLDAAELGVPALIVSRSAPELSGEAARVVDGIAAWLRARSDLDLRSADQAGVDRAALTACVADELFGCVVRLVGETPARWLFLVSLVAEGGGRASASVFALDLRALRPGDDEDAIYGRLVVVRVPDVGRAELAAALEGALAAPLDASGSLDPFGEVALDVEGAAPLAVELDGRVLGPISGGAVRVVRVRPGERTVAVVGASGRTSAEVQVSPRETAHLSLAVEGAARGPSWGLWSGAAVAGLGAAALVIGIADTAARAPVGCLRVAGQSCDDAGPLGPPTTAPVTGTSGWVTVGVGAVALGTSWMIGAWLDEESPWAVWGLGVGVGVGAASVAVTLAL